MKLNLKFFLASILASVFVFSMSATARAADDKYFEISSVKSQLLRVETLPNSAHSLFASGCDDESDFGLMQDSTLPIDPIDEVTIIVDKIINLGKKIWAVVEAGRPVVNFKSDTASALPKGARCWQDLGGWKNPRSFVYGVTFENGFGMEVVNFQYRVLFVPGGSVNGIGQYIAYAAMQPVQLDVAWGYTFNANASVPSVFNQGTKSAPLAGMQLNMNWSVATVLKRTEETQSYFINGTGEFKQLK